MKLPATATFAQFRQLLTELDHPGDVLIDASGLRCFDSSTVALLLEARRRARQRRAKFEVRNAPPKLHQLAALYGVEDMLWSN